MKKLVAVFIVPGIVFWFIHSAIGDPYLFSIGIVPDNIVPNSLKVLHGEYYLKYPLSLNLSSFLGQTVYRLLGPYDEPGVIGTLAALILSADNFRLNSKSNLILIIAGILSFSLTFYILTVLYFFLKGALRPKMFVIFAAILTFQILPDTYL